MIHMCVYEGSSVYFTTLFHLLFVKFYYIYKANRTPCIFFRGNTRGIISEENYPFIGEP